MSKRLLDFTINLLFPKFCLGCKKEGFWLCPDCQKSIEIFDSFYCPVCKKRLPDGKICEDCRRKTKLFRFFAAAPYDNNLTKELIHKLKYSFVKDISKDLAIPIVNFLKSLNSDFSEFLIIPVPLHKSRLRWRGFNQANEIAKEISKFLKIPLISNNLVKIKSTKPQVEISDSQKRKENVQGAFRVKNPKIFAGKKIILVDDIYTTGSTMEECAKVLKRAGAKEIRGIVVAR